MTKSKKKDKIPFKTIPLNAISFTNSDSIIQLFERVLVI